MLLSACGLLFSFQPNPEWNELQDDPIIVASNCCGFVTRTYAINHIFDAQIWGDGQMIWTSVNNSGVRTVWEAHLSDADIRDLIQAFVDSRFFLMDDEYGEGLVADASKKCLEIDLISRSKRVCETFDSAPPEFGELYMTVWRAAWNTSTNYQPQRAFLKSELLDFSGFPEFMPHREWSIPQTGLSLSNATHGICIGGTALDLAWGIVNEDMWVGVVLENREVYQITLQISGVSMVPPESSC